MTAATQVDISGVVGSGSGWLLIDDHVSGGSKSLPAGFASNTEPGADDLLFRWECGDFRTGILWVHQTSTAAVLAVPTARPDGSGLFLFFLWRGVGPVLPMPAWYTDVEWQNGWTGFRAAHAAARAFGNSALGIGSRPA